MRNHAAQLAIIKQLSRQELRSTAGNCQADDRQDHAAQLAIVKKMSRQKSRSSAGPDYVTEHALFTWLIIHLSRV